MSRRNRKEKSANAARQPAPGAFQEFLAPLPPRLRALAVRVRQCKPPCLLCQQPYYTLGVFTPYDHQRWGVPPGWLGGWVYTLCERCMALPNREERVEATLWQSRTQTAAPWN